MTHTKTFEAIISIGVNYLPIFSLYCRGNQLLKRMQYYNLKNKLLVLNLLVLFLSTHILGQNQERAYQEINGTLSHLNTPLANVNIIIEGTSSGTKSDSQGQYTIKAKVGDLIKFSHLQYNTISIIVEDVTSVLNIEMTKKVNELKETLITGRKKPGKTLERWIKAKKKFSTSLGEFNPEKAGYSIAYVDGEEITNLHSNVTQALLGRVAGYKVTRGKPYLRSRKPAIWDVDGFVFQEEPPIDIGNIRDIYVIRSLAGTNRYGSAGAGGVIVVRTKFGSFENSQAKKKEIAEQYTNKNYYIDDAAVLNGQYQVKNTSIIALQEQASKSQNPEILKSIAYQFQELGLKKDAIKLYESIFKLRPKYAQSYRDLANAYIENNQYKKSWRLYMSYLLQGNDVSGEGIGEILYNEMEFLYYHRKNQAAIQKTFVPKSRNLYDFRNDVRFVFEWNASEAEFDLEFVNAEKRVYAFEHSLGANQKLITDEKQKGYASKEFFIDDIGKGEWMVNMTYYGNKKPEPTYFKITQYFNWGKSNQTKSVKVYKFQNERDKIQLLKLNKRVLVASN